MIKYLKLTAKITFVSILLVFILLGAGLWYLDNNLLSFEGKTINEELKEIKSIPFKKLKYIYEFFNG